LTQAEDLAHELATEQAHVDAVYARLDQATDTARSAAAAAPGHLPLRPRQLAARGGRDRAVRARRVLLPGRPRLAELDAEHEGLVFGRLDLDDPTEREVRYIGRIGVRDDDYEPLVIDWRARAAEPFYRATPQQPMDVVRRRVLRCRNDRSSASRTTCWTREQHRRPADHRRGRADGVPGAGPRHDHARHRRHHPGEQDEAIRADYQGVTVISGGPGTGKTVVALHRAAYLLYSNRRRFERGGVLVVGPGPVFMNYIERVLPSLGEDSVTLRSIGSVVSDVLPEIASDTVDDADTATVKGSLKMVRGAAQPGRTCPSTSPGTRPASCVTVKGEVLQLRPPQLARIRGGILAHQRVNLARESAQKAVVAALASAGSRRDGRRAGGGARPDHRPGAPSPTFMDAWWPTLTAPQVLRRLGDARVVARAAEGLLDAGQQALLVGLLRRRRRPLDGRRHRAAGRARRDPGPGSRPSRTPSSRSSSRAARRWPSSSPPPTPGPRKASPSGRGQPRDLRARARRRGPGRDADAVADAAPPRRAGVLDGRRRPGPERAGPTWRRWAAPSAT
jgi:hypothetical protein